jgi:hypothetical protein
MWWLLPLFPLHTLLHHLAMNAFVPLYQTFDTLTKHTWSGRATSLLTQLVLLPTYLSGNLTLFHHGLGMYILADMGHMMMYLRNDWMAWFHHVATTTAYVVSFYLPRDTTVSLLYATFLLESTSPLIHICWFANKAGYSTERWFPTLAGLTLLVYTVFRCIAFPYYVVTQMPKILWGFGGVFTAMNYVWLVHLVGYARAVLTKAGASRLV